MLDLLLMIIMPPLKYLSMPSYRAELQEMYKSKAMIYTHAFGGLISVLVLICVGAFYLISVFSGDGVVIARGSGALSQGDVVVDSQEPHDVTYSVILRWGTNDER